MKTKIVGSIDLQKNIVIIKQKSVIKHCVSIDFLKFHARPCLTGLICGKMLYAPSPSAIQYRVQEGLSVSHTYPDVRENSTELPTSPYMEWLHMGMLTSPSNLSSFSNAFYLTMEPLSTATRFLNITHRLLCTPTFLCICICIHFDMSLKQ